MLRDWCIFSSDGLIDWLQQSAGDGGDIYWSVQKETFRTARTVMVANSHVTQCGVSMLSYANVHIYTAIMHTCIFRITRDCSIYTQQVHKHASLHAHLPRSKTLGKDRSACTQQPGV